MTSAVVVVLDIGKTNAKICAVDKTSAKVLATMRLTLRTLPGPPYRHLDTEHLWQWFVSGLRQLAGKHRIVAIVPTAHGATFAAIDAAGLVLPVLDYEDSGPEQIEDEYAKLRPPFAESLSPPLPGGLNYGRGMFWLARRFADRFARARHVVSYAQYWSWRLCGVAASEVTSIGSHSDLWNPAARTYSSLVDKLGWAGLFPPLQRADAVLGSLTAELARSCGIGSDCAVHCGIHDSNASLLPWLDMPTPLTVSSTGTWVINFGLGASLDAMDPDSDCAANVSMFGQPIACSRWMGGREFASLAGDKPAPVSIDDLLAAAADPKCVVLPNQHGHGGPYQRLGIAAHSLADCSAGARHAAAALYCAMMLDTTLALCGDTGGVVVEGAFARNELLLAALASLRPGQRILVSDDATGTTAGAVRLAVDGLPAPQTSEIRADERLAGLADYRRRWLEMIAAA